MDCLAQSLRPRDDSDERPVDAAPPVLILEVTHQAGDDGAQKGGSHEGHQVEDGSEDDGQENEAAGDGVPIVAVDIGRGLRDDNVSQAMPGELGAMEHHHIALLELDLTDALAKEYAVAADGNARDAVTLLKLGLGESTTYQIALGRDGCHLVMRGELLEDAGLGIKVVLDHQLPLLLDAADGVELACEDETVAAHHLDIGMDMIFLFHLIVEGLYLHQVEVLASEDACLGERLAPQRGVAGHDELYAVVAEGIGQLLGIEMISQTITEKLDGHKACHHTGQTGGQRGEEWHVVVRDRGVHLRPDQVAGVADDRHGTAETDGIGHGQQQPRRGDMVLMGSLVDGAVHDVTQGDIGDEAAEQRRQGGDAQQRAGHADILAQQLAGEPMQGTRIGHGCDNEAQKHDDEGTARDEATERLLFAEHARKQ